VTNLKECKDFIVLLLKNITLEKDRRSLQRHAVTSRVTGSQPNSYIPIFITYIIR